MYWKYYFIKIGNTLIKYKRKHLLKWFSCLDNNKLLKFAIEAHDLQFTVVR